MDPNTPDHAVAELLNGLNKGQYLILAEAIRRLGGTLQLDWTAVASAAGGPLPPMHVEAVEGLVVLHLAE